MIKTDNFFVIHNWNTVPEEMISYTNNYIVYDASDDNSISEEMQKRGISFEKISNSGHNITGYIKFFIDYYEELPEVMCLTKGHLIGRHCTKEFFDRVYDNKYFTGLFDKSGLSGLDDIPLCGENYYIEKVAKGSLVTDRPNKLFLDSIEIFDFIFQSAKLPSHWVFAPGACYIVRRESINQYPKEFWINLQKIVSYECGKDENGYKSSAEAHFTERLLPLIFLRTYSVNDYMYNEEKVDELLQDRRRVMDTRWHEYKPDVNRNSECASNISSLVHSIFKRIH